LLLVAYLLVNAPNCHLSLVLASAVQGDAVNCITCLPLSAVTGSLHYLPRCLRSRVTGDKTLI